MAFYHVGYVDFVSCSVGDVVIGGRLPFLHHRLEPCPENGSPHGCVLGHADRSVVADAADDGASHNLAVKGVPLVWSFADGVEESSMDLWPDLLGQDLFGCAHVFGIEPFCSV